MSRRVCVCVPARDEAARLPMLIDALAAQSIAGPIQVSICVNNSSDGSAAIVRRLAAGASGRLAIHVAERVFAAGDAHAGSARRCAMDEGAARLDDDGAVLISTDADCRPPTHWIAAILGAMADDHIVGGRIVLDDAEALPDGVAAIRARLDRYWETVRAIEDEIDPLPWDAPPRHGDHTGASLALTVGLYRRAGGVPPIACGEDRALVENARIAGGRLIHPADVWTWTSPRQEGRAAGGMASAMAALSAGAPAVPAFHLWRDRALWRRGVRDRGGDAGVVLAERALPPMPCDMALPGMLP